MIIQILVSAVFLFLLLFALIGLYARCPAKTPYYLFSEQDCVLLLTKAVNGELLESEWYAFIGVALRGNEELESLRESCIFIDENCVKTTHLLNGQVCVLFNEEVKIQLKALLDEWCHKVSYKA
jgi:hypothetical protein